MALDAQDDRRMMIDGPTNVVVFTARPRPAPSLQFVEFRLDGDGMCGIQMTLHDEAGNAVVLEYKLTGMTPQDFDLDRLRAKWVCWRDTSDVAR